MPEGRIFLIPARMAGFAIQRGFLSLMAMDTVVHIRVRGTGYLKGFHNLSMALFTKDFFPGMVLMRKDNLLVENRHRRFKRVILIKVALLAFGIIHLRIYFMALGAILMLRHPSHIPYFSRRMAIQAGHSLFIMDNMRKEDSAGRLFPASG
jgi:hypothetical protein